MHTKFFIVIILASLLLLPACGSEPTACFTVLTPADSIKVGYPIRFDASCSIDAEKFYWTFGDYHTSNVGRPTHVYDSAGTYDVFLLVSNAKKSSNKTQTIIVKP